MHVSLLILLLAAVLIASGIYMLLERTLSRIIMGAVLAGNGINLLFLLAIGTPGTPPFEGSGALEAMSDPLPMAMVLTAIVISRPHGLRHGTLLPLVAAFRPRRSPR